MRRATKRNKALDALDRKEADAIAAAMHNVDAQTLATLQAQLRAGVENDMQAQVAQIRAALAAALPGTRRPAAHPVRAGQRAR